MGKAATRCIAALLLACLADARVWALNEVPDPFAPADQDKPNTAAASASTALSDLSADDHSEMAEHLRQAWSAGRNTVLPYFGDFAKDPLARQGFGVALYHYWAAIRATDLSSPRSHLLMMLPKPTMDWTDLAIGLHEEKTFRATILEQLTKCPGHKVSWQTSRWIHSMMASRCWTGQRHDLWSLMNLIITRQPHMLHFLNWKPVVQDLDESGMHDEAATLAQAIILAPEPTPEAMQITPSDAIASDPTMLHDMSYAEQILDFALAKEPAKFIDQLHNDAQTGIKSVREELWLTAKMKVGSLTPKDLEPLSQRGALPKLLRAVDLMRKAPGAKRDVLKPWINEGLDFLFSARFFDDYPTSCYAVQDAFDHFELLQFPDTREFVFSHLTSWLNQPETDAELLFPPAYYEFLCRLSILYGTDEHQEMALKTWMQRCHHWLENLAGEQEELYIEPFAELSRLVPAPHAARLADVAADLLLERFHAPIEGPRNPNPKVARAVICALLVTDQKSKLGWLSSELERIVIKGRPGKNYNPELISLLLEMRSLQGALLHRPDCLPQVVAWTRNGKTAADPPEIVWELVAPLFDPATLPEDDILHALAHSTPSWRATMGLRSPLMETLAGLYDVSFEIGESATALKPAAEVAQAGAHGKVAMQTTPPLSGYLRATLRDRTTGKQTLSPLRPYSLEPAVLSTGAEPCGPCGSPWLAGPHSTWIGSKPAESDSAELTPRDLGVPTSNLVPIDQDQTYLLTIWNASEVQPDGTDGPTDDLHDLSIVFLTEDQTNQASLDINVTQASRNSKYHVGCPLYEADQFAPHKFATGTIEVAGQIVAAKVRSVMMVGARTTKPAAWPLFQLRPIHLPKEPKAGSP